MERIVTVGFQSVVEMEQRKDGYLLTPRKPAFHPFNIIDEPRPAVLLLLARDIDSLNISTRINFNKGHKRTHAGSKCKFAKISTRINFNSQNLISCKSSERSQERK